MMNLIAQSSRPSASLMDLLPGRSASNFSADDFGSFMVQAVSEPGNARPTLRKAGADRVASQDAKPVEARSDSENTQTDKAVDQDTAIDQGSDDHDSRSDRDASDAGDEQAENPEHGHRDEGGDDEAQGDESHRLSGGVLAQPGLTATVGQASSGATGAEKAVPAPGSQVVTNAAAGEGVQAGSGATSGGQSQAATGEQSGEGKQQTGQGQAHPQAANQRAAEGQQNAQPVELVAQNRTQAPAPAERGNSPSPPTVSLPTPAVDGAQAGRMPTGELQMVRQMFQPDDEANVGRLSRALQSGMAQKGGAITLRLTPPDLGLVRISLQLTDTTVTARFAAQNPEARQMLERSMEQLRASLERQGLVVERLTVREMPATQSGDSFGSSDDPSRWAGDGRSRQRYARQQPQAEASEQNGGQQAGFDEQLNQRIEVQ